MITGGRIANVDETERRGEYDLAVTRATQTSQPSHQAIFGPLNFNWIEKLHCMEH